MNLRETIIWQLATDTFLSDLSVTVLLSASDHNMIILKTNLEAKAANLSVSLPYWDFEHADYMYASINAYLNNINLNYTFSSSITVEGCWNSFSQILCDIFNRFIPVRFITDISSNYKRKRIRYPRYIRVMRKRKAILWKHWKVSNALEENTV